MDQNQPLIKQNPNFSPYQPPQQFQQQQHQPAMLEMMNVQQPMPQIIIPGAFINGMPTDVKGRKEQQFYCLVCQRNQMSKVRFDMGTGSWIFVAVAAILFLPVACCPCYCEDCQDAIHECPECHREVGRGKFCS